MYRCCAAISGKNRAVQIERSFCGSLKYCRWQNLECYDDDYVWVKRLDFFGKLVTFYGLGLQNIGDAQLDGSRFDGRNRYLLSSAATLVLTGDDGYWLEAICRQNLEGGDGEIRRPHEDYSHRWDVW